MGSNFDTEKNAGIHNLIDSPLKVNPKRLFQCYSKSHFKKIQIKPQGIDLLPSSRTLPNKIETKKSKETHETISVSIRIPKKTKEKEFFPIKI